MNETTPNFADLQAEFLRQSQPYLYGQKWKIRSGRQKKIDTHFKIRNYYRVDRKRSFSALRRNISMSEEMSCHERIMQNCQNPYVPTKKDSFTKVLQPVLKKIEIEEHRSRDLQLKDSAMEKFSSESLYKVDQFIKLEIETLLVDSDSSDTSF